MNTLSLVDAAQLLKLSPEALRRKAKAGLVPGAKIGKKWCFLEADLVSYLRSRYASPRQASLSGGKEVSLCHSIDGKVSGGCALPPPVDNEYAALLGLPTGSKPRNSTIALKRISGKSKS